MTGESTTFRVGQEVRVTYTARVAEVGGPHAHREGRIIRLETSAIPTGWVDPTQEGLDIDVINEPLPTEPGMYSTPVEAMQSDVFGPHHTDGQEFYYLNTDGEWVDIGFGIASSGLRLTRMVELPF